MEKWQLKLIVLLAVFIIAFSSNSIGLEALAVDTSTQKVADADSSSVDDNARNHSYKSYLQKYSNIQPATDSIPIDLLNFTSSDGYASVVEDVGDSQGTYVKTGDDGFIEWKLRVEEDGMYNIKVVYYPVKGKGSSIVRSLKIDGSLPFDEAGNLTFTRSYINASDVITDSNGNQIRPSQIEKPIWLETDLKDTLGYYNEPLQFYFARGEHTLRFDSIREPLVIGGIRLYRTEQSKSYSEVNELDRQENSNDISNQYIEIQGESAVLKSDSMLYPLSDHSSPAVHFSSPSKILLNTVGGVKWQSPGQWLTWDFEVKEAGLYKIGIKAKQDFQVGQPSYRKIYIDGKVPFNELRSIKFPYNTAWKTYTLGGSEEPYLIYLSKGSHSIKMEVVLGDLASMVQRVSESKEILNIIYRKLLMIVGTTPDTDRDYQFDKLLPDELAELRRQSDTLMELYKEYSNLSGIGGYQTRVLYNAANLAKQLGDNPRRIAKLFTSFEQSISSLATWINISRQQPLQIDYISVATSDVTFPKDDTGIFNNILYAIKRFFITFTSPAKDEQAGDDATTVWISSGRDQFNALNQMIINDFTKKTGIQVDLKLVPHDTLLMATLANKGPDVALSAGQSEPLNYAIRGAVEDLSQFDDFTEVAQRFQPSALEPLTFNGKVYGIPETQSFPIMFYRADILKSLGLSVPQTWDDVIAILPDLQKKNMSFALPVPQSPDAIGIGLPAYATLLYQNGGRFYKDNQTKSALDSQAAVDTFYQWTRFYSDYTLPMSYDFVNRFRSGEIPIGIADYGTYNMLSVFAPELEGVWKLALVPGTVKEDGTVDRTVASSTSATIMLKHTGNKQNAWEFIKWWSSAPVQEKYGQELESIMGTAARYQTANVEALYNIPWSTRDFKVLIEQLKWTKGIPEVPGSYMTPRYVDFAFKKYVVNSSGNMFLKDPGQIMFDTANLINAEITEKRFEFGLDQ